LGCHGGTVCDYAHTIFATGWGDIAYMRLVTKVTWKRDDCPNYTIPLKQSGNDVPELPENNHKEEHAGSHVDQESSAVLRALIRLRPDG